MNFVIPSKIRGQFMEYCKRSECTLRACKEVCKEAPTVPSNSEAHFEREEVEDAAVENLAPAALVFDGNEPSFMRLESRE